MKTTRFPSVDNDDKLGDILNYNATRGTTTAMKQTVAPQDAELMVNGTAIKRSTNSISDALQVRHHRSENQNQNR